MLTIVLIATMIVFTHGFRWTHLRSANLLQSRFHSSIVLRSTQLLQGQERERSLHELQTQGWKVVDNRDAITKSYRFADFVKAFTFMTQSSFHAERLAHHPEWFNVYNKVDVTLSTHDVGGVSHLDVELAKIMDKISQEQI